jgi:hypothetical protein
MVYEYVAKNRELRVLGRNLALVRAERRSEALQSGRRREFSDFKACLVREELALQVWYMRSATRSGLDSGA